MRTARILSALAGLSLFLLVTPPFGTPCRGQRLMVELDVKGRTFAGTPLAWSSREVLLLARDGRLWDLPAQDVAAFRKRSTPFSSFSAGQMRAQLLKEFGSRFDVSGTGHYLVVHPSGQRDRWARRFEDLYRSFVHYFAARGFQVDKPAFPLVAVVFHDRPAFLRHARSDGARIDSTTLGYYSSLSNRILLFDVTEGRATDDANWQTNAETIIHEAAHQSAFNCGIHGRHAAVPRWIVEGLGTGFEAPGVWNARSYKLRDDRINRQQLELFRTVAKRRRTGYLAEFLASDRPFQVNADAAYAEAWALSFFLIETRPRQYFQLLSKTAALPPFEAYPGPRRLHDFTEIFGADLALLESHYLRFLSQLQL